jgi:hypothetical protein
MNTSIAIISISILTLAASIWLSVRNLNSKLHAVGNDLANALSSLGSKIANTNQSKELSTISEQLGVIARTLELKEENASKKPVPLTPLQVTALAYIASTCEELHDQKSIDLAYMTAAYLKQAIKRDDQHELENVLRQCIAFYVVAIMKLVIENSAIQENDVRRELERKGRLREDIAYLSDLKDGLTQLEANMEIVYAKSWFVDTYCQEIRRLQKASLISDAAGNASDVLSCIVQAETDWGIGKRNEKNDAS